MSKLGTDDEDVRRTIEMALEVAINRQQGRIVSQTHIQRVEKRLHQFRDRLAPRDMEECLRLLQ